MAPAPVVVDLADLEDKHDARIGVYAVDTVTGRSVEHRADERFAYASTIKALAVGVLLDRTTPEQLYEPVPVTAADITAPYSPVTERRVGTTMTLDELAAAAAQESDNSAANMVIARLGGPAGLEQALRSLGDTVTEVDRLEPGLNEAVPGDPRDTSSPRAMATTLAALAVGDALDDADRAVLNDWLEGSTTGAALVRAAVPEGWTVGDKSGSGRYGTRNDIAVVRPPGGGPVVVAVMTSRAEEDAERSDALVAAAAARVLETLVG
ncbi:class A beta-lactamase [Aquipuribacter hungaricus]|uniref:Beta-lactamase n=1 Tax=Aquipuribacter hungaricus TaxID=545624 RepID=A0ABV7WGN6_9MICO